LFNVKCTSFYCSYHGENFTDPIAPALQIPLDESDPTTKDALHAKQDEKELDIADAQVHLPSVARSDLPTCPKCHEGLLRPGVVWFGESLPSKVLNTVDSFINDSEKIDLIMVIGTSASVYPAAAYVDDAREKGARVAVINADRADEPAGGLDENDWFFEGDAAQIIPNILKSVIGEVEHPTATL
jgi:NAD-dependent deacetylase sirtuin 5